MLGEVCRDSASAKGTREKILLRMLRRFEEIETEKVSGDLSIQ
jgi:hypothetical protein